MATDQAAMAVRIVDSSGNIIESFNALGVASATSLALGGAAIGGNALAVTGTVNVAGQVDISSGNSLGLNATVKLYSAATATFSFFDYAATKSFNLFVAANNKVQFGAADAASPVAQTLQFQNGSGTNIAGVNATIIGPLGTGTGVPGDIIFQTGDAVASGTGASTAVTAMTIKGETQAVNFAGAITIGNTLNSVSPTSPNRTITMVVGGTTVYIAAKTTND